MAKPLDALPIPFLTRSWLVIPPVEEAAINAGLTSGADVLVFDLSVLGKAERRAAAERLRGHLEELPERDKGPALFMGLPALDDQSEDLLADLTPLRPDGIMLMEMTLPTDLQALDAMLSAGETLLGLPQGRICTAAALAHASSISVADVAPRLVALAWSADSLAVIMGAKRMHDADGMLTDAFRQARASVLIAAAEAGVEAIDTESGLFSTDRLARDCAEAAADGFAGKIAFSPRQVVAINHGFQPDEEDVLKARAIIQTGSAQGLIYRRAVQTLRRAAPEKL